MGLSKLINCWVWFGTGENHCKQWICSVFPEHFTSCPVYLQQNPWDLLRAKRKKIIIFLCKHKGERAPHVYSCLCGQLTWCKVYLSPYFTTGDGQRSLLGNENQGISLLWQLKSEFVQWQRILADGASLKTRWVDAETEI